MSPATFLHPHVKPSIPHVGVSALESTILPFPSHGRGPLKKDQPGTLALTLKFVPDGTSFRGI